MVGPMGPCVLGKDKLKRPKRWTDGRRWMEQGGRGFMDFLADVEDQMHLCHSWEGLTGKDMKRISLLCGLKDRTLAEKALAEEYSLKQIIQAAVNRESSKANAEALRNRPTRSVNRLDEEEVQYKGGSLEARMNHLMEEMEEVRKLRQNRQVQEQAQGQGGEGAVPEVHVQEARGGTEVPGRGQDVQHMQGQGPLWCVQAVQKEEEEGREASQGGAEGDFQ